ncbi:MAG: lysophospholipid acyltransferase family protein [Nitriliruptoraceae bacterium]
MTTPHVTRTYRIVAMLALGVFRVQRWQFDVQGAQHVPTYGGAVIAANHIGFLDFVTVAREPWLRAGRPVRILAKSSLFALPLVGGAMRRAGHIPVERSAGGGAYRAAVTALRAGELLLVLPEQTISPAFELRPLRNGAARMAAMAGVPLVPAVSWGSHRFHTVGHRPRPRWRLPVSVAYGEPLTPHADDDATEVTAILRQRMQGLLDAVQSSYPHGNPRGSWWVPARRGGAAPTVEQAEQGLRALTTKWVRRPGRPH